MRVTGTTDVGRIRSENQDAIRYESLADGMIIAVADGMGGHAGGATASKLAISEFTTRVEEMEQPEQIGQVLLDAVNEAHDRVSERAAADPSLADMGTTLVGAYIFRQDDDVPPLATIVNVGDSRAYHIDDGIEQVTVDHSLVQKLVKAGEISPEDADDHPQSNILSQALGSTEEIEADIETLELTGTLLLCSDGVTDELEDGEIAAIVESHDVESAVGQLVNDANEAGGSDNISVVLARK